MHPRRFYYKTVAQFFGVSDFSVPTILVSFTNGRHPSIFIYFFFFAFLFSSSLKSGVLLQVFICNPKRHVMHDIAVIYHDFYGI